MYIYFILRLEMQLGGKERPILPVYLVQERLRATWGREDKETLAPRWLQCQSGETELEGKFCKSLTKVIKMMTAQQAGSSTRGSIFGLVRVIIVKHIK